MKELIVLLSGRPAAVVRQDRHGRLGLEYYEDWQNARGSFPLSLSMPLATSEHGHAVVDAFIWGLLPDNELILDRWAKRYQVSPRNAFALMTRVGEDCAGAVQFVRPERLDDVLDDSGDAIEWLSISDIAARLRSLRQDPSSWRQPDDKGQFSLDGAQPKTALI